MLRGVQLVQAAGARVRDTACALCFVSPGAGRCLSGDDAGSRELQGAQQQPDHPALAGSRYSLVHP